ncbi:MAG: Scr1 family TA system antitoxin-like transcriptional regulator [Pseudonocardiaceae bacterium]
MHVDLEADAEEPRQVQLEISPGIHLSEDAVEAQAKAWKERQKIFVQDDPPAVSFVLSESCPRREVGSPEVMHAQHDYHGPAVTQRRGSSMLRPLSG